MAKWRCCYLPHDGGGDKRGWSLRGSILYPVLSEHGTVLAWVGLDSLGVPALGIMSNRMT